MTSIFEDDKTILTVKLTRQQVFALLTLLSDFPNPFWQEIRNKLRDGKSNA